MTRVLVVDDHALVRAGLRRVLEDQGDVDVIGEAESGEQALELVRDQQPDVALMDLNMPGMGGMEAIKRLLSHGDGTAVVAITAHSDRVIPRRVLDSGARALVTKDAPVDELLQAVSKAARGERYVSSAIAQKMALSGLEGEGGDPFADLSQREMQVLMMAMEGYNNQAISEHLCLSPKTVSTYRTRLVSKLGVNNDIELMRLAIRHGLIEGVS